MSEETNEQQQTVEPPKELNLQQSFNLLVNIARQSKLTYDEHALVDKAVRDLHEALNLQE